MTKKKKVLLISAGGVLLLLWLTLSPLLACLRSQIAMAFLSARNDRQSVGALCGFELKMPSGEGWYPRVLTHNADRSLERLTGRDGARLTILYNFPAFDHARGCSRLFDEDSDYYNSFYGAYLTRLPDGAAYGFDPETAELEKAAADLAWVDFFGLVLSDFGFEREERIFEYELESEERDLDLLDIPGWTRIDARLRVNGASHEVHERAMSYWQYGKPRFPASEPFAPVDMSCTVIARYFDEYETTVFFYVMASNAEVRDDCVENIIPKSSLAPRRD